MDVSAKADTFTDILFDCCCKTFLTTNKMATRRRNWLPPDIMKHIKARRIFNTDLKMIREKTTTDKKQIPLLNSVKKLVSRQRDHVKHMLNEYKMK